VKPAPESPRRRRLKKLSAPLRHRESRDGVISLWQKVASVVYSPRILQGLPAFAETTAKTFWDQDPSKVIDAICDGDPALFIAYQIRLDQLDIAMLDIGRTIADRAPLIRARYILDGFRESAQSTFEKRGGRWPLKDAGSDAPEPPESSG